MMIAISPQHGSKGSIVQAILFCKLADLTMDKAFPATLWMLNHDQRSITPKLSQLRRHIAYRCPGPKHLVIWIVTPSIKDRVGKVSQSLEFLHRPAGCRLALPRGCRNVGQIDVLPDQLLANQQRQYFSWSELYAQPFC